MIQMTEQLLTPTDSEKFLDEIAPIRLDRADMEVYASHRREQRAWRFGTYIFAATTVLFSLGFFVSARRGPVYRFIGIDRYGNAAPISENYNPREPEVRRLLTDWVTYRYTRNPKIASSFPRNYLFFDSPVYNEVKAQDDKDDLLAKAVSGNTPPVAVEVNPNDVVLQEFAPKMIHGKMYWAGRAFINMVQITGDSQGVKPHKDHTILGVTFIINLDQVGVQTQKDPTYADVNFIGLTIVSKPQENHIAEAPQS